jgi:AbrB family looped-hinge helix DNA binding protein
VYTLTVSSKGQITVPRALRERLKLGAGTRMQATVDPEGRLVLVPAQLEPEELMRSRPKLSRTLSVEQMDAAIQRALRGRV